MPSNRFVAAGSLMQRDLDVIGGGVRRAFPLPDTNEFASLLIEIDRSEQRRSATSPGGSAAAAVKTTD